MAVRSVTTHSGHTVYERSQLVHLGTDSPVRRGTEHELNTQHSPKR